jgi:predicted amidohydrolase YtcJ
MKLILALTQDIFHISSSSLPETRAVMTMIDGKVVSGALVPIK